MKTTVSRPSTPYCALSLSLGVFFKLFRRPCRRRTERAVDGSGRTSRASLPSSRTLLVSQEPLEKWTAKMPWNSGREELVNMQKQKKILDVMTPGQRSDPSSIKERHKNAIIDKADCVSGVLEFSALPPPLRLRATCPVTGFDPVRRAPHGGGITLVIPDS